MTAYKDRLDAGEYDPPAPKQEAKEEKGAPSPTPGSHPAMSGTAAKQGKRTPAKTQASV